LFDGDLQRMPAPAAGTKYLHPLLRLRTATSNSLPVSHHVVSERPGVIFCGGAGRQAKVVHVGVAEEAYWRCKRTGLVGLRVEGAPVGHNSSIPDEAQRTDAWREQVQEPKRV